MENIERTEIAGNIIKTNTNYQKDNKMENEVQVQNQQVEIKINLSLEQVIEGLKASGNLTSFVLDSDNFREKVDEIAGNAAETTFEEKADTWISDYISSNAYDIVDTLEGNIESVIERNIDYSEIATEIKDDIDIDSEIEHWVNSQLSEFRAGSGCSTAKEAARVIIDTIRYDLVKHLRSEQGAESAYSQTITDSLTKFIDERIEVRLNEEKEQYLKNKQGYMQEAADKLNEKTVTAELYDQPTITVEQFKQFINGLDLYQVTKDRIISEFSKLNY